MKKTKNFLAVTLITGVLTLQGVMSNAQAPLSDETQTTEAIKPFQVHVPKENLTDLRKRITDTRWPDRETVTDQSQGANLLKLQGLLNYWGTGYDWRKAEAKLNASPQFTTNIDGVDIYFIHVRSKQKNALP